MLGSCYNCGQESRAPPWLAFAPPHYSLYVPGHRRRRWPRAKGCRIQPTANGTWKARVLGDSARAPAMKELNEGTRSAGRRGVARYGVNYCSRGNSMTIFEVDVSVSWNICGLQGVIMNVVEWAETDAKFTKIQLLVLVFAMRLKDQNITFLALFYLQNVILRVWDCRRNGYLQHIDCTKELQTIIRALSSQRN